MGIRLVSAAFLVLAFANPLSSGPPFDPATLFGPAEHVRAHTENDWLIIESDGLPHHPTSNVNPNSAERQHFHFRITLHPQRAGATSPVPARGPIGVAINGVAIFGPQNAEGQDAVMVEMFDQCGGHPDPRGVYHYHRMPDCLVTEQPGKHSAAIGVAFDGFLIYGKLGSNGKAPSDLDACNGHTGPTPEFPAGAYHYHATTKFPYLLGCYSGTPSLPRRPDRPPEFGRPGTR